MADLFSAKLEKDLAHEAPLADRLRPTTLEDFFGQERAVGKGTILRRSIENDELFSILFWGPPGTGKTTLARIIARLTRSFFVQLSAVTSGKADLTRIVREAEERRKFHSQRTILFIDEIHRWNKAQQDALLPFVEPGIVTLIGATTENPSFEIIGPLLSRCRVIVLEQLTEEALGKVVDRALADGERGLGEWAIVLEPEARRVLLLAANGDARSALNILEIAAKATAANAKGGRHITKQTVVDTLHRKALLYDKAGEEHYNIISAFIKSMRASDPDAALYWLMRMVEAGEDPLFIARRMVVFASEDVGLADPQALSLAVACFQACDFIGYPECRENLAHVVVYLAKARKDRSAYEAMLKVEGDVKETLNEPVPMHLRNAPTKLMKELGYGKKKAHGQGNENLPSALAQRKYLRE